MIFRLSFTILTVLTVISGENQNEFGCERSQIFCEAIRKCVESTFVCSDYIKFCSNSANPNSSNETNCFGVNSKPQSKTQVCPENWFGPWKRSCYFFRSDVRKSWFDARQECRNLQPQAKLASSSVSVKELASVRQRVWTDFIWIGENKRQKRFVTAITREEYWSRRQVQCPALPFRNMPRLFTQNVWEERSCNELLNFICELRIPEVKNSKTGNWISKTPDAPLQVFTKAKNLLAGNMKGDDQGSGNNSQPIKVNSRALVQGGSNLSTHGGHDRNTRVSAQSKSNSAIVVSTISRKSLHNHASSTSAVPEAVHRKDEFSIKKGDEKDPVFQVRPSRKLEKSLRMFRTVWTAVNMVSSISVRSTQTLPLLPPVKVWSQDDRIPRARALLEPVVFAEAWGLRGARQGGKTLLSGHSSMITRTILSSESYAASITRSMLVAESFAATLLTSQPSRTDSVTAHIPISNLSVSATGQHVTPSLTIKPTPSRAITVNHTSSTTFTHPSKPSPKPTTQTSTGSSLSQTAVVGLAASGGAVFLLTVGFVLLCCWLKRRRERSDTEQAIRTSVLWDDSNWDVRFSTGITSLSDIEGRIDWAAAADGVELTPSSTATNKTFLY